MRTRERGARTRLGGLGGRLGPRFLLGALGGVCTLVTFGDSGTRRTMRRLDGLLQRILCSGRRAFIPLRGRLSFVHGCMTLVHVHLPRRMRIDIGLRTSSKNTLRVTPLVFVSLVRGTFGRNVDPAMSDFVDVSVFKRASNAIEYRVLGDGRPGSKRSGDKDKIKLRRMDGQLRLVCPKRCR